MHPYHLIFLLLLLALCSARSLTKGDDLLLKVSPDSAKGASCNMTSLSPKDLKDDEEYYTVEFFDERKPLKRSSRRTSADYEDLASRQSLKEGDVRKFCPYGNNDEFRPNIHIFPIQQSGGCCPSGFNLPPSPEQWRSKNVPRPQYQHMPLPQPQEQLPMQSQPKPVQQVPLQPQTPPMPPPQTPPIALPQAPPMTLPQPQIQPPSPIKPPSSEPQSAPKPNLAPASLPAAVKESTTNKTATSGANMPVKINATNAITGGAVGQAGTSNKNSSTSNNSSSTNSTSSTSSGGITVTEQEFNSAVTVCGFPQPASEKYKAFIAGIPNSAISSKRELAMFLANILHESDGLQAKSEIQCQANGCKGQYDAAPDGTVYFGRGYTQLTWKANYAAASKDLFGDENILLSNPNSVATDEKIAWATAFWYWKTRVHTAPGVAEGKFGATTKAINGALECGGGSNPKAVRRFEMYTKVLKAFGINETPIESGCYN